jgi:putative redox protein
MSINNAITVKKELPGGCINDPKISDVPQSINLPITLSEKKSGLNPLDYQLFSLAGCVRTIGRIVAKKQNITLRDLSCEVQGDLDSDASMNTEKENSAVLREITIVVIVDADMTPEQKEIFIQELDRRCPISDVYTNTIPLKLLVK